MADFRSALASGRTLLLDGGMGTMLQARGLPAGEHPEQFCLDRPDVLRGLHAAYLAAGAAIQVLTGVPAAWGVFQRGVCEGYSL